MSEEADDFDATGAAERQDPARVREAAKACLAAQAGTFAWVLQAIAMRRTEASAGDWALIVQALLDPGVDGGVEEAVALAETCLDHAWEKAPGDPELRKLRAAVADRKQGLALPKRGESPQAGELVEQLLDALDTMPAASVEAFLSLPPEVQDVVVTELGDEAEPRTAPLVAAVLQSDAPPALCCYLLESAAMWATHPEIRNAIIEVAGSSRRELLEPFISDAIQVVEAARGPGLLLRPDEGRSAPHRPTAEGRARPPSTGARGVVFAGTAQRWAHIWLSAVPGALSIMGLIALVVTVATPLSSAEDQSLALRIEGVATLVFGVLAAVLSLRWRVPFRIFAADDGVRFEIDDGARSLRLRFPLDYSAAWHEVIVRGRHTDQHHVHLTLALRDEAGDVVVAFDENLGTMTNPPRGWVETRIEAPRAVSYGQPLFGRLHLERLTRELARWNREAPGKPR